MPWPRQPRPDLRPRAKRSRKGDQYIEVYEYDLNGGLKGGTIKDRTFIIERLLLLANLP